MEDMKAVKDSSEMPGVREVVKEALGLPFANCKLMIDVVSLLVPISFICVLDYIKTRSMWKELPAKFEVFKYCISLIVTITFSLTFSFGGILTIVHTSDVYMRESTNLKELLSRAITTWKRRMSIYCNIGLPYYTIIVCTKALFDLSDSDAMDRVLRSILFVIVITFIYMTAFWILSCVIFILEERDQMYQEKSDQMIVKAIEKARDLIIGKKVHVHLMLLLLPALCASISLPVVLKLQNPFQAEILGYAMACILIVFIGISQPCIFIVFTVFYYEVKKSRGE